MHTQLDNNIPSFCFIELIKAKKRRHITCWKKNELSKWK